MIKRASLAVFVLLILCPVQIAWSAVISVETKVAAGDAHLLFSGEVDSLKRLQHGDIALATSGVDTPAELSLSSDFSDYIYTAALGGNATHQADLVRMSSSSITYDRFNGWDNGSSNSFISSQSSSGEALISHASVDPLAAPVSPLYPLMALFAFFPVIRLVR